MQPPGQPEHPQDAASHPQDAALRLSPAIRVSDQDRDHVAQTLQAAFAEGRLDDDEFDERMRAALTARTSADLEALSADLPAAAGRGRRGASLAGWRLRTRTRSGAAAGGACPSTSPRWFTRAPDK